jgi:hypothetical protein
MVRLSIDFEHTSRTWWENGGQELWEGITEDFDGSSVVLDTNLAESWLAEAAKVSGWAEGNEYSPHPIARSDVDEFEDY